MALERQNWNALKNAILEGDAEAVGKALESSGIDVNGLDPQTKYTPLSVASVANKVKIAELLLERGANPLQRNGSEPTWSPRQFANGADMITLLSWAELAWGDTGTANEKARAVAKARREFASQSRAFSELSVTKKLPPDAVRVLLEMLTGKSPNSFGPAPPPKTTNGGRKTRARKTRHRQTRRRR
jgi:ankyrin repeat protein